jgi:hypothetical protein
MSLAHNLIALVFHPANWLASSIAAMERHSLP